MSAQSWLPQIAPPTPEQAPDQAVSNAAFDPNMAIQSAGGGGNSWLAELLGLNSPAKAAPEAESATPATTGPQAADPQAAAEAAANAAAVEEAKKKLGDKFQVVGDDFAGDRASNQVSPEEFERIAQTYADVSRNKTSLKLDTTGLSAEDAKKFQDGAMGDIGTMMQTQSGRELIEKMAYNNRGADGTEHTTTLAALDKDTKAERAHCSSLQPGQDTMPRGSDSRIVWHPGQSANVEGHDEAFRSDVILYHEMVHAMHNSAGSSAVGEVNPVHPNDCGISQDEYQAVGLPIDHPKGYDPNNDLFNENLYRRERNGLGESMGQRKRYRGKDPLAGL